MKNLEFLRKTPIAHRGLFDKKDGIPENSLPAFERAIAGKYPIELDVHLLEDGKLVVFHDDDLNRMTGVKKKIKDCTYEEIKELKLGDTPYGIPLFSEVLELVNGRVPLLIELKYDRKAGETEKALVELLENYQGEYAVQSFSPNSLLWFKKYYPEIPRGQLASDFKEDRMLGVKKFVLKNLYLNFLTSPDFVAYSINSFPNKRVESFRKTGKLVLGWTVRNNEGLRKASGNCDNFIGENLETLDMSLFKRNWK